MALLEIEELGLSSKDEILLQGISLSINKGEIVTLLGSSGAGKTTLLRLVAGLDTPESGRIVFDGQDMAAIPPHRRSFGMMFQEYALFPHLDVAANIRFGLEMQHVEGHRQEERIAEVLDLMGLQRFGNRSVASLSGGERQRVALARCLAPKPRLLLLDEPLASLDLRLRDRLADEIHSILKQLGITTLFVTHDQSEAFAIADRIAVLHEGRLKQFDSPEAVYRHPASLTVASFLGFHNLLSASEAHSLRLPVMTDEWGEIPSPDAASERKILLIRPEAACILPLSQDESYDRPIISGIVERRKFQGRFFQLTVILNGRKLVFDLPPDPIPPEPGEIVQIGLNPAAMVWLNTS